MMRYAETVVLKDGVELLVRNAGASDARALRETMRRTHSETDYLLSYPDEQSADDEQEARSLAETERSDDEVELVAVVDGKIVGSAGVAAVGSRRKVAHRARFGISVLKELWGMGIAECSRRRASTAPAGRATPSSSSMWWQTMSERCPCIGARGSWSTGATPGAIGPRPRGSRSSCT